MSSNIRPRLSVISATKFSISAGSGSLFGKYRMSAEVIVIIEVFMS
jgi:hypothetical protein